MRVQGSHSSLIPREVRVPVGAPASPVHTLPASSCPPYWPGPLTVSSSPPDSFLSSSVQMAPSASQSVVAFRTMTTSALELGGLVLSYEIVGLARGFPHLLPPDQPNDQFESI